MQSDEPQHSLGPVRLALHASPDFLQHTLGSSGFDVFEAQSQVPQHSSGALHEWPIVR